MVMTTSPREWSKPALMAAVWPKLRRKRTTTTRGSPSAARAASSKVSSAEPSST